jgi:3-methyladenine DNA glycosylase/8-oxoguanine DNA glycosylase
MAANTPAYWLEATQALAARDAFLKEIISRHDGLAVGSRGDAFCTLARAIVGQQISVKAAMRALHTESSLPQRPRRPFLLRRARPIALERPR